MERGLDLRSELFTLTLVTHLLCIIWSMLSIWFHQMNDAVFDDEQEQEEYEE